MSAVAVQPISNFETNAGSFRGGKNRGPTAPDATTSAPPIVKLGSSSEAFQKFRQERQAKSPSAKAKRVPQAPAVSMKPTRERLEKEDTPARTVSGTYRAP